MTVYELIKKLEQMCPDSEVITEGCDCYGDCADVVVDGEQVLLTRTDGDYARRNAGSASGDL